MKAGAFVPISSPDFRGFFSSEETGAAMSIAADTNQRVFMGSSQSKVEMRLEGLIILNIGKKSGVRVGMPLRILRADQLIGSALVVDVRESITGAVLQKIAAEGEDVKVGDRIEPEAQQL